MISFVIFDNMETEERCEISASENEHSTKKNTKKKSLKRKTDSCHHRERMVKSDTDPDDEMVEQWKRQYFEDERRRRLGDKEFRRRRTLKIKPLLEELDANIRQKRTTSAQSRQ